MEDIDLISRIVGWRLSSRTIASSVHDMMHTALDTMSIPVQSTTSFFVSIENSSLILASDIIPTIMESDIVSGLGSPHLSK